MCKSMSLFERVPSTVLYCLSYRKKLPVSDVKVSSNLAGFADSAMVFSVRLLQLKPCGGV